MVISDEEYQELQLDSVKLQALMNAGVDNWDGYDFAMDSIGEGD